MLIDQSPFAEDVADVAAGRAAGAVGVLLPRRPRSRVCPPRSRRGALSSFSFATALSVAGADLFTRSTIVPHLHLDAVEVVAVGREYAFSWSSVVLSFTYPVSCITAVHASRT